MTKAELWAKANKEDVDFLCYLWGRWQDEKKYEDIQDYLKAIQTKIPEAYKITKRPFGIYCKCTDGDMYVSIKRKGNYLNFFCEHKNC